MLVVVEGKSDKDFLNQYALYKKLKFDIINNDGNILKPIIIEEISSAIAYKTRVCIVFDADKSYANTLNRLRNELGTLANKVDIFLFPNNKDSGELETLLIDIAKQPQFIECFDNYVECVKSKNIHNINAVDNINKKSKMFAYREVSGLEKYLKKLKDDDKTPRNFLKTNEIFSKYFDFDSPKLDSLREFLCGQI